MLTKLTLQNFQCHRKLEIPLSRITTIVGASDVGKSVCIRALNYVCLNNLRGNSFITHGEDKCSISLEADGQSIQRIKTKTSNSYATDINEYAAVSSEVPPDIAKNLNIGEINIANQHDPLFWFSLTSGQLAKELNAIADIAWVDRVLQVSVSDLRKLNAELDVTNSRILELESEAKQTEWVPQADEELQRLESLESKCAQMAKASRKLSEFVDRLGTAQIQTEQLQAIVDDFVPVQKAYISADSLRQQYKRLDSLIASMPDTCPLQAMVDGFEPVQEDYTAMTALQQRYKRLDSLLSALPESIPPSDEVEKLQIRLRICTEIESAQDRLTELIEQCEDYESQIQARTLELKNTEQELHKQCQGVCPICQHPLPS
jgi:DNA repair exonuclease SbcCD ATPase subunit